MSGIVLSSSVRQNLLSLQSTADLLATTQSRLATGKKVNSALDNPTNFFTASSLDSRASDINNLLDGIGNGVQILQAANTGITSLQKLVDSAKSIANQALQTTVGYAKSTVTSAASTATGANLLGASALVPSSVSGTALLNNQTQTYTPGIGNTGTALSDNHLGAVTAATTTGTAIAGGTTGGTLLNAITTPPTAGQTLIVGSTTITITAAGGTSDSTHIALDDALSTVSAKLQAASGGTASFNAGVFTVTGTTGADLIIGGSAAAAFGLTANTYARGNAATTPVAVTAATKLAGAASPSSNSLPTAITTTDTIVVNGKTIHFFDSGAGGSAGTANATNAYLDLASATVANLQTEITNAGGVGTTLNVSGTGQFSITSGIGADITTTGTGLGKLGLAAETITRSNTPRAAAQISGTTALKGNVGTNSLTSNFAAGESITVNGNTIAFYDSSLGGSAGNASNTAYLDVAVSTVANVLTQIDAFSQGSGSAVANGKVTLNASTAADLVLGDNASGATLAKLGLVVGTTPHATAASTGLAGKTLTIGSTGGGVATNITFGTGAGQISNLNDLNTALAANNLQASINTTGQITLTTTNNAASDNIGTIGGTATDPGFAFAGAAVISTIADANSQATRASLVEQYNQTIEQIKTTAQDSSFNGVNLLNGDALKLVFNETGKSTLNITGVTFDPAGLGLSSLLQGTDFIDNSSTNKVLSSLNTASSTLRTQASALGSNLSIVQIRQDFSKNLINVLQTGSSNLTLADTNEEAANSQALSTRQSIAVSALALANQSQQSVLQLLR
jgi:flagellin